MQDSRILQSVCGHKIEFIKPPFQLQERVPANRFCSAPQVESVPAEVQKLLKKKAITLEDPVEGLLISSLF